jgi:hypothetical protein
MVSLVFFLGNPEIDGWSKDGNILDAISLGFKHQQHQYEGLGF